MSICSGHSHHYFCRQSFFIRLGELTWPGQGHTAWLKPSPPLSCLLPLPPPCQLPFSLPLAFLYFAYLSMHLCLPVSVSIHPCLRSLFFYLPLSFCSFSPGFCLMPQSLYVFLFFPLIFTFLYLSLLLPPSSSSFSFLSFPPFSHPSHGFLKPKDERFLS